MQFIIFILLLLGIWDQYTRVECFPLRSLYLYRSPHVLFSNSQNDAIINELKHLIARKELPSILPKVVHHYSQNANDLSKQSTEENALPQLLALTCISRALNNKMTERVGRMGMVFLQSLQASNIPIEEIALGVVGLFTIMRSADIPFNRIEQIQASDADILSRISPMEHLPSSEDFFRSTITSPWLAWPGVASLRSSLLQRPPGTPKDRHVLALAMVEAIMADRKVEIRVMLVLAKMKPLTSSRVRSAMALIWESVDSALQAHGAQSAMYDNAMRILDAIVESADERTEWRFIQGKGKDATSQLCGVGWGECRRSGMLKKAILSACHRKDSRVVENHAIAARLNCLVGADLGAAAVPRDGVACLCLGDGDLSHSLHLAKTLPQESRICACSYLSEPAFTRLYKNGSIHLTELRDNSPGASVHFQIDAMNQTSVCSVLTALADGRLFDVVVFNFPFADQVTPRGSRRTEHKAINRSIPSQPFSHTSDYPTDRISSFDTFYMAKGRHMDLLDGIFSSSNAVTHGSGRVVIALLLHQAVAWEVERLAVRNGFRLCNICAFDAAYNVRRSNVDSTFPADLSAWSFTFEKKTSARAVYRTV